MPLAVSVGLVTAAVAPLATLTNDCPAASMKMSDLETCESSCSALISRMKRASSRRPVAVKVPYSDVIVNSWKNPGVETFVRACQAAGLKTLLISGGFTFFSERIRHRLGLDFARANTLGVAGGRLTGTLFDRPWGDIVDGAEKKRVLLEVAELMGIEPEQCIAVGDGANDLPMMKAAGLSIAYHPKPAVAAEARVSITAGGLDRALAVLQP